MDRIHFVLKNDRVVMKTTTKNRKRNDRFLMKIVLKNDRFQKRLTTLFTSHVNVNKIIKDDKLV